VNGSEWAKRLKAPFVFVEWRAETAVYWLKRSALVDLVNIIAGLFVIVAAWQYVRGADDRKKARQYQAWQVINLAHGKGGSGGRIAALRDLLSEGVDLSGVDLSKAWLMEAPLRGARLRYAKLDSADLWYASLRRSNLAGASAVRADFFSADLRNANISRGDFQDALLVGAQLCWIRVDDTDFRNADFTNSNLLGAEILASDLQGARMLIPYNWRNIVTLGLTNIYGLRDAPEGFERFALDSLGAVAFKSHEDWKRFKEDPASAAPYRARTLELRKRFALRQPSHCWNVKQLMDSEPPPSAFSQRPAAKKQQPDTISVHPMLRRP
jgi:hypothetical protein